MEYFIALTEARNKLSELIKQCQSQPIWILRHSQPVGVLISPQHYEALLNEIEDLRDSMSVVESHAAPEDLRLSIGKAKIELGLT